MAKKSVLGKLARTISKVEKSSKRVTKALKGAGKDFEKIK